MLYLNPAQLQQLREDFDPRFDVQAIMSMLHMEVVVDRAVLHPHAAWTQPAVRRRAG